MSIDDTLTHLRRVPTRDKLIVDAPSHDKCSHQRTYRNQIVKKRLDVLQG